MELNNLFILVFVYAILIIIFIGILFLIIIFVYALIYSLYEPFLPKRNKKRFNTPRIPPR